MSGPVNCRGAAGPSEDKSPSAVLSCLPLHPEPPTSECPRSFVQVLEHSQLQNALEGSTLQGHWGDKVAEPEPLHAGGSWEGCSTGTSIAPTLPPELITSNPFSLLGTLQIRMQPMNKYPCQQPCGISQASKPLIQAFSQVLGELSFSSSNLIHLPLWPTSLPRTLLMTSSTLPIYPT